MRDFIEIFTDDWVGRIMGIFILLVLAGFAFSIIYPLTHKCLKSHDETQYQQPMSVVVGGSKYGGGVAVPIGNIRPVNVTVCDDYAN